MGAESRDQRVGGRAKGAGLRFDTLLVSDDGWHRWQPPARAHQRGHAPHRLGTHINSIVRCFFFLPPAATNRRAVLLSRPLRSVAEAEDENDADPK